MSFGDNVGDIIDFQKLITYISFYVRHTDGPEKCCDDLLSELKSLQKLLRHIDNLRSGSDAASSKTLLNISYTALNCRYPLDKFLENVRLHGMLEGISERGLVSSDSSCKLDQKLDQKVDIRKLCTYLGAHIEIVNTVLAEHGFETTDIASGKGSSDQVHIRKSLQDTHHRPDGAPDEGPLPLSNNIEKDWRREETRQDPIFEVPVQPCLSKNDSQGNVDWDVTDDNSDRDSVMSQADSIWSVASLESTMTGLSVATGYNAAQIETATQSLLQIFLAEESLAELYKLAMERARIGPERLQRNVQRLLRFLAQDLQADAKRELEKQAARLVSFKAGYVARAIIEKYQIKSAPDIGLSLESLHVPRRVDESSDEEEDEGNVYEDHVDEDLIEDLSAFRLFVAGGPAFAQFKLNLEAFVMPSPVKMEGSAERERHHQSAWRSKIRMVFESLFITVGLLEPPLNCGMTRIRWKCQCGERFFGDVKQYRPDGVKDLVAKMRHSTGAQVTVNSYSKESPNQNWTIKTPAWARRITATLSSAQAGIPSSPDCLPRHNTPNQCAPSTSSASATGVIVPLKPTLFFLACMHRSQQLKCLAQDSIDAVSTDQALFCLMERQIRRNRNRIRSILAMRSVQGMFFVKRLTNTTFRLRTGNTVEVRNHNPCCTSINPNTCECIPPAPMVEPSSTAEYRCSPVGPLATWPPILSEDLMHMLSSPKCVDEKATWVLDQLPKRTVGELQVSSGQVAEGWGMYYQEGIDFDMIISVVFVVFILASLLFAILWTKLEMDIQGAFGVSSYMVTASGIFLAWIANRAKSIG